MPSRIVRLARELRRNQTPEEEVLWQALRNRKLSGYKFLRQHPVIHGATVEGPCFFIADFYCAEARLLVELDGAVHDHHQEEDHARDRIMAQLVLRTLRIKNGELRNLPLVLNRILQWIVALER